MARPLRRVLIGLSIRVGIGVDVFEGYQMPVIREYLAMLGEINKPAAQMSLSAPSVQQTPEQMQAALVASLGHMKG